MRVLAIIPARYASTRFPAKPLALLGGVSVIERVYRQVSLAVDDVVVATDDERIFSAVEAFGGGVVMTSVDHKSGTDRCYEAYTKVALQRGEFDIVVNVQGDEPFIQPEQIRALVECFERDEQVDIATLVKPFEVEDGVEALENPNTPKVVVDSRSRAIYFSRSVIPYLRGVERSNWLAKHQYYRHIGMYGFRAAALSAVTSLPMSALEVAESLEQLRWIENGYQIGVGVTMQQTIGIDTPEDLEAAERFLASVADDK
ncbi:MAG: 3-deoxy-manno-octulosonate cytidylyltransferase [Rikenellaceae bacterium]